MQPDNKAFFVDALGKEHPPADARARIVSLVPSLTELLFALGLGAQLVGRTSFCIHPDAAVRSVTRVGGTKKPNLEKIAALQASHIVMNVDENRREDAQTLEQMGMTVLVTHPQQPCDNLQLYRFLGGLFGKTAQAEQLATRFDAALTRLYARRCTRQPRRVLYLIWQDPYMTVSRQTYIASMLALAGLHTVPEHADSRYPSVTLDAQSLNGVDWVLLSSEPFPFREKHARTLRTQLNGCMPAHCMPRVALIDGEMMSWYGSRAIAGLDYLDRFADWLDGA